VEVFVSYLVLFLLAWPLGLYMARVFAGQRTLLDSVLNPLERGMYALLRINPARGMTWRGYALALLWSNLPIAVIGYLIFVYQGSLPLNPDGIGGMSWDLALHTAISFITNTNQQHYSGQAQLSYLAQLAGIVTMQIVTPAVGLAAFVAVLRGISGGLRASDTPAHVALPAANLGNYYVDVTRAITRVLLPLSFVLALLLTWQGVPSTFDGARTAVVLEPQTVEDTAITEQRIPVGPVAAMVAIKQLGTNGGGWYGPNSAVPLENPTPLSNLLEVVAILLIPVSSIFMVGSFTRRTRFGVTVMGIMVLVSAVLTFAVVTTASETNPAFSGISASSANMEGVEQRFGPIASAIWATWTTQSSNGSVNAMHDSLNPIAGLVPLVGMWLNVTFGGDGVGFLNFFIYLIVAVFIAGLMVGRTPELFGRKIEAREMKLASLGLLISPLLILVPSALAVAIPGITGNSNPGFHGLSQVVYEYSSAVANNGSGFEGLGDNTVWWNVTTSICLLLARFIPIIAPLAIAGYVGAKKAAPEGAGTLRVDTPIFAATTLSVILIVGALSYFPVAVMGPIAERLTLGQPLPQPVPLGTLEPSPNQPRTIESGK
jgi:potassium-transporting ATPase potassium-binding subunit